MEGLIRGMNSAHNNKGAEAVNHGGLTTRKLLDECKVNSVRTPPECRPESEEMDRIYMMNKIQKEMRVFFCNHVNHVNPV